MVLIIRYRALGRRTATSTSIQSIQGSHQAVANRMFFQRIRRRMQWNHLAKLIAMRDINDATNRGAMPSDTRICRLYGLVADTFGPCSSNMRLVGILLDYIRPKRCGILSTLQYVAHEKQSKKHLRRWADDLDVTVGALRQAECRWGDAKPKNVLVGHEDNVWLVDLVDGFMPGWVDENKQGTATGDVEALHQIRQWLERLRAD